jgi:hypothetical protein
MPIRPRERRALPEGLEGDQLRHPRALRRPVRMHRRVRSASGARRPAALQEMNGASALGMKGWVMLTVAHLNHTPADCRDENLKAMCQRCHLRYDVEHHQKNASATRRRREPADHPRSRRRAPGVGQDARARDSGRQAGDRPGALAAHGCPRRTRPLHCRGG